MTPRQIATAMRKGSTLRPQGFGSPLFATDADRHVKSCALQAAAEGATGNLLRTTHSCVDALGIEPHLADEIWMRNDSHQTREQIADWLDTLEPAQRQTFEKFMAATLIAVEVSVDSESQSEVTPK